jgi:hypothetical protein
MASGWRGASAADPPAPPGQRDPGAQPPLVEQAFIQQQRTQREGSLQQIAAALVDATNSWTVPAGELGGQCVFRADAESGLDCDSAALADALRTHQPTLAGLLRARRDIDTTVHAVRIAVRDGRFEASWSDR